MLGYKLASQIYAQCLKYKLERVFFRMEMFLDLFNVRVKETCVYLGNVQIAVEILEGLDIFPQTKDYLATCPCKLSTFSNYWLKSASKAHHWLAGVLWAHVRLKWGDRGASIIGVANVHYSLRRENIIRNIISNIIRNIIRNITNVHYFLRSENIII